MGRLYHWNNSRFSAELSSFTWRPQGEGLELDHQDNAFILAFLIDGLQFRLALFEEIVC